MTEGQGLQIFSVNKQNLVGLREDTFPGVKEIKEIRMKTNDFPVETISEMRKQDQKRNPIQPSSTSHVKRVIFGRKNQLIRMMKKRGGNGNAPRKSLYIRVN